MEKGIWFFEEVDLYDILCPYKYADHLKTHPLETYKKEEFLFMEGDSVRDVFLIANGKVKVGYYDDVGNEYVRSFIGKGELLGEMALYGETRYRDFAQVTQNNTQICRLRVERALELARDYMPFALTLNKRMSERVQRMERRLQILLFKDARQRLMEFIKDLVRDHGEPYRNQGKIVKLDITQGDMAALIGTSRKTISLLFTDLENEGVVKFYGRKELWVPDLEKLG